MLQTGGYASLVSGIGLSLAIVGLVLTLTATESRSSALARVGSRLLRAFQTMDRSLRSERFVYRHHRWFGLLISGGAAVLLLSAANANMEIARALMVAQVFIMGLSALILCIGITVFVRPSVLKPVEQWANRQIAPFPTSCATCRHCGVLLIIAGGLLLHI